MVETLGLSTDFVNQYNRLYTKYGEEMMRLEGISKDMLNYKKMFNRLSDKNTNVANASIDSSANVSSKSIGTIQSEARKPQLKIESHDLIYNKIKKLHGKKIADEFLELQVNGAYYMHDSVSAGMLPYCYSFSLEKVHEKGLFFIKEMKGEPAKHLSTWVNHVCEFIGFASNSLSGAVAIPDMLLYMYKYWKDDVESGYVHSTMAEKYKKQQFQAFIFRINQPITRDNVQSAYTNLQILDRPHLMTFFGDKEFKDGTMMFDYFEGFLEFQKDFLEYERELRKQKFFTFPVLTASLKINENYEYEDEDTFETVIKHNLHFQDMNIYNAVEINGISSCCRLVNDLKEIEGKKQKDEELKGFFSSIGGTSLSIGSCKVLTINFARLAYEAKGDLEEFFKLLQHRIELAHKALHAQRECIKENIAKGLLPIYDYGLIDLNRQFSTIGINGLFECVKYLKGISCNSIGEYSYNEEGNKIALKIFDILRELNARTVELYGYTANTEQIPGESCSIKLNAKDRILFGNRIVGETKAYGNQWIPLATKASMEERIKASAKYDSLCGGGAILHINIGEPIQDEKYAIEMAKAIAKKGVVYYSMIYKFQYCKEDHSFYGGFCPICGGKAIGNAIKIVGYIVKDEHFHDIRKEELENRIFY